LADEVYQDDIYNKNIPFHSFAKVMSHLKEDSIPLFSFHSISKGYMGECGHRGGYLEIRNVSEEIVAQLVKMQSISLCSNTVGQLITYLLVTPPKKGEESYPLFIQEHDAILNDLKEKAEILNQGINEINGMSMDIPTGALYAFVKIDLPHTKDILKMSPQQFQHYEIAREFDYCMAMLIDTGICVIPGAGFGQLPGTLHFRITFLASKSEIRKIVQKMKQFHERYLDNY
jgi:aspartate/methionine/tyrosine aminotransferase